MCSEPCENTGTKLSPWTCVRILNETCSALCKKKKKETELMWGSSMTCAVHCVKSKGQNWAVLQFAIESHLQFWNQHFKNKYFQLDKFRLHFLLFTLKSKLGHNWEKEHPRTYIYVGFFCCLCEYNMPLKWCHMLQRQPVWIQIYINHISENVFLSTLWWN